MTSLENLLSAYNDAPEGSTFKGIMRRCLNNIYKLDKLNIYELAELCYTSPPTISRMVKSLGFKNYNEFQHSIASCIARYDFDNRFYLGEHTHQQTAKEIVFENMSYIMSEFDRCVEMDALEPLIDAMHAAKSVSIFPYGIRFMESALQCDLIMSGIPCDLIMGDIAQAKHVHSLGPEDLAFFLCPDSPMAIKNLTDCIQATYERKATIAILSSTSRQKYLDYADFVYHCNGRHYMVDSFFIEMVLAVIDIRYRAKYLDAPQP